MAIKKRYLGFLLLFSLLFTSLMPINLTKPSNEVVSETSLASNEIKTSGAVLVDKVFAFIAPGDVLPLDDLYFEGQYTYYISVEIVTNHSCTMNIKLWDPDDTLFEIFDGNLTYKEPAFRSYEIPFGTVMSGNHSLQFETVNAQSLNILIHVEKGIKVLHDKITPEYINGLASYHVGKFSNLMYAEHLVSLETDVMYRLYLGRVSPISCLLNSTTKFDYYLDDPGEISYVIEIDALAPDADELYSTIFGTAVAGVYKIKLTIYCIVGAVNMAYAVAKDVKLTDEINGTAPLPTAATNSTLNITSSLPVAWTTITVIGAGATLGIVVAMMSYNKKKTSTSHKPVSKVKKE